MALTICCLFVFDAFVVRTRFSLSRSLHYGEPAMPPASLLVQVEPVGNLHWRKAKRQRQSTFHQRVLARFTL